MEEDIDWKARLGSTELDIDIVAYTMDPATMIEVKEHLMAVKA